MKKLILASKSPYRKELLERLAVPFECHPSHVDENAFKESISDPLELTKVLSFEKANKIFKDHPHAIVIGSDQVSLLEGVVLGKPKTFERAVEQLSLMSGKTHELITSVCVMTSEKNYEFFDRTVLTMNNLNEKQIKEYILKDDPLQCAGSYKIETLGITLFEKIETSDFTAITGLPLMRLSKVLRELNLLI